MPLLYIIQYIDKLIDYEHINKYLMGNLIFSYVTRIQVNQVNIRNAFLNLKN